MTKKKTSRRKRIKEIKIDIDQVLLKGRQVFLFGVIDCNLAINISRQLIALDKISHEPIAMYINSPGGSVSDGFAIIDAIKGISSPVITMITGQACSMAGLISVCSEYKLMTKNSVWMAHDMSFYLDDYATKAIDRTEFYKLTQAKLFKFLREHTKLTEQDIETARHGELWLESEECLKKGIVKKVLG